MLLRKEGGLENMTKKELRKYEDLVMLAVDAVKAEDKELLEKLN